MTSPKRLLAKAYKIIALVLCLCLFLEQGGFAQGVTELNISFHLSQMVAAKSDLSIRQEHLRALLYDANKGQLRFAVDGGERPLSSAQALIKSFFIGISLPNDTFWVNLRPDAPSRMIDPLLGQTDLGKTLLEADLQLKKDLASSTNPQTPAGKLYWDGLYKKAEEIYGTDTVNIPTLTRVWIVPGQIVIAQTSNGSYIYKATLRVMLEQDYLKDAAGSRPLVIGQDYVFKDERSKALNEHSSRLIRELIIPQLTKEVNTAKRYAALRQIYYSLILAQCFKARQLSTVGSGPSVNSSQIAKLINSKDLANLTSEEDWDKETYFQAYKESFQKGEYNIQELAYSLSGRIIRNYFSGGINFEIFSAGSPVKPGINVIESKLGFAPPLLEGSIVVDQSGKPSLISGASPIVKKQALPPEIINPDFQKTIDVKKPNGTGGFLRFFNRLERAIAKTTLAIMLATTLIFSFGCSLSTINTAAQHSISGAPKVGSLLPSPEQLNPVDSSIPPQLLKSQKLMPYYEIIRKKDTNSIPRLLWILKQHDDSKWEGFSLGALFKAVIPMGGVPKPPTYQIEASVGNLLSLLRSGYQHIMARFDTADPSEQAAAAWVLGEIDPPVGMKTLVITGLKEAMLKSKTPQTRIAAADSIRKLKQRGHITIGAVPGVSTQDAQEALNDKEWLVRFYMAEAIDAKDFPQVKQLVFERLKEETHPYVLLALVESVFRLKGFGAVLPAIQATKNLKFSPSEDYILFSVDSFIWKRIAVGLANFGNQSPQTRRYLLAMFVKELHYLQSSRVADKYDLLNYNLIPLFEQFVRHLRINTGEIKPLLSGLDSRVVRAILNVVETKQRALPQFPTLGQAEDKYQHDLQEIKSKNPALVKVIQQLEQRQDRLALHIILTFGRNTALKVLAADALSRIGDVSSMRVLVAGLDSSHPTVRAANARALRNLLGRWQFVYTGKNGSLIQAFNKAVDDKDWVTAGYLIGALTAIGDADALEPIASATNSYKNRFIQMLILESFVYFGHEGAALTNPIVNLLSARDTDLDVLIRAIQLAAVVLDKSDDPVLVDEIIKAVVAFPINLDSPKKVSRLRQEAIKALRHSRYSRESLQKRYEEELARTPGNDLKDYEKVNAVKLLLEGVGRGSGQKKSRQEESKAAPREPLQFAQAYPALPVNPASPPIVTDGLPRYGGAAKKPYPRVRPQEDKGQPVESATTIEQQLLNVKQLNRATDSATRLRIIKELGGLRIAYPPGKHPLVEALLSTNVNDLSTTLAVVEAAENAMLSGSRDKFLIDALLDIFLKLPVEPEIIRAHPQIITAYLKLVQIIKNNPAYGYYALNIKLGELLGRDEYKVRLILFIARLANEQAYNKLARKSLGRDIAPVARPKASGKLSYGSRIESMLQEFPGLSETEKLKKALEVFMGLSDYASPKELAEVFAFFGNIDEKYMHPAVIRLALNALNNPKTEDMRIAASYFLAMIDLHRLYQIDLAKHKEVEALVNGLEDPKMGFDERLSRLDALCREASPYIVAPLIDAYYAIWKSYSEIEARGSVREKERTKLIQAIIWALEKVKDSAVDKIRTTLENRLNNLNYADCTLITFLQKYAPKDAAALMSKVRIMPVKVDPLQLVSPYNAPPWIFDEEREALKLFASGLKEILVPNSKQEDLAKLKAKPGYFEALSDILLHDLAHPERQAKAAHLMGELQDWRFRLVLTAALSINNPKVVANVAWALAQYEAMAGQNDPAIEPIKQKLAQSKDPYERSMLALVLGSLGGTQVAGEKPAAISLAGEMLNDGNEGVKLIACKSAEKLTLRFNNNNLIAPLTEVIERGFRSDAISLITSNINITYEFSPSAQAAFDVLKNLADSEAGRPLFVGAAQQAAAKGLRDNIASFFTPDVKKRVLEQCVKKECKTVYDAVSGMRLRYFIGRLPLIGFYLFIGFIGFIFVRFAFRELKPLIPWKIFVGRSRSKIKTMREITDETQAQDNKEKTGSSPLDNQASSSPINGQVSPVYEECRKSLQTIRQLLEDAKPADEKFSSILTEYYLIIGHLPIATEESAIVEELARREELKRRSDFLSEARDLLKEIILQLDKELAISQQPEQKQKLYAYQAEFIKYFQYLSYYLLAIGQMTDLISIGPYGEEEYSMAYGWKGLGDKAEDNLAFLMKKIYTAGNAIVQGNRQDVYLYRLPENEDGYTRIARQYRETIKLKPVEASGDEELRARRRHSRMTAPILSSFLSALGAFTINSIMMGGVPQVWQILLSLFAGSSFGYFVAIALHKRFIGDIADKQNKMLESYEAEARYYNELVESRRKEEPSLEEPVYQMSMLEAQRQARENAFTREVNLAEEATAGAILVMTRNPRESASVQAELLRGQGLLRRGTPVFVIDNTYFGNMSIGSGDIFVKSSLLFKPGSTFKDLLDELKGKPGVICLNEKRLKFDAQKISSLVEELGTPVVLYAGTKPFDLKKALGNAYRLTQAIYAQGRPKIGTPAIVHINADVSYDGPLWDPGEEDFTEYDAWASLDDMEEGQKTGRQPGMHRIEGGTNRIIRLYEKFGFERVTDWLWDEIQAGRYDMENKHKLQINIPVGITVVRLTPELYNIILEIEKYKRQKQDSGGVVLPLYLGPDIKVPLGLITHKLIERGSVGAELLKYSIDYPYTSNHFREEFGITGINDKLVREFHDGLFEVIQGSYPKNRRILSRAQVPYPHEASYEIITSDSASSPVLEQGNAASLTVFDLLEQEEAAAPVDNQVSAVSAHSAVESAGVGGIDLRLQDSMFQIKDCGEGWQPEFMPLNAVSYDT